MNTSLREEVEKLKVMTGQLSEGNEEIIAMDQIEQALFTCTSRLQGQASFQENVFGGIPTTSRYMKACTYTQGTPHYQRYGTHFLAGFGTKHGLHE